MLPEELAAPDIPVWRSETLDWSAAKRFSRVIREADRIECQANGMSVYQSLLYACSAGPCWAVYEDAEQTPLGVWGWTRAGAIWSYWADLNATQSRHLLRCTPPHVLEMLEQSTAEGIPALGNFVWVGNRAALAWLRASHCFIITLDRPYEFGNKEFYHFKTKPLEELRKLCATQ
jgi:hypothetical protein